MPTESGRVVLFWMPPESSQTERVVIPIAHWLGVFPGRVRPRVLCTTMGPSHPRPRPDWCLRWRAVCAANLRYVFADVVGRVHFTPHGNAYLTRRQRARDTGLVAQPTKNEQVVRDSHAPCESQN